jgi:FkbM family methyltransferase
LILLHQFYYFDYYLKSLRKVSLPPRLGRETKNAIEKMKSGPVTLFYEEPVKQAAAAMALHNVNVDIWDTDKAKGSFIAYFERLTEKRKGSEGNWGNWDSVLKHLKKFAKKDSRITIAPRMALGESDGLVSINVAANSESSSLLTVSDAHLQAEPRVRPVAVETVQLSRLDTVALEYLSGAEEVFLKIDVQGYELPVLRGASALLPKIRGVQLELSLLPLYEGEPLYREVIEAVESFGFALHDLNPCFSDSTTGMTYQLDGIFFRK